MKDIFKQEKKWLLKEKYNNLKSRGFEDDLKKLNSGVPVAYLIGSIPFLNSIIDLEYRPLIPRPETEFWVNDFINQYKDKKGLQILDIFSGSGCIGIGILKNINNIEVDFSEINPRYVKQIRKNLQLNFSDDKQSSKIYESNVFDNIPKKKYNIILANPPYISKKIIDQVQHSVLENEDHNALFTEDNGLFFLKKLVLESPKFLKENGELWIEFDSWQVPLIKDFLDKEKKLKYKFWIDQYKKARVLIVNF